LRIRRSEKGGGGGFTRLAVQELLAERSSRQDGEGLASDQQFPIPEFRLPVASFHIQSILVREPAVYFLYG
jgi:hypothetical protein